MWQRISQEPTAVDLAVIAVPLAKVPTIIEECVGAGVNAAIMISAGGRETGTQGRQLEEEIKKKAERGGLRIC